MTDSAPDSIASKRLKKRYRKEKRFQLCGIFALCIGVAALVTLLSTIFVRGFSAFERTVVELVVDFDPEVLEIELPMSAEKAQRANTLALVKQSIYKVFPEVSDRRQKRELAGLLSSNASFELSEYLRDNPEALGSIQTVAVTAASPVDQLYKGNIDRSLSPEKRLVSDMQLDWFDSLVSSDKLYARFNTEFFFRGDSRYPEIAGIGGAIVGSFFTLLVCLLCSFPIAVATAVYLEEFAPKNRITEFIEVNINNLAAVPSIIYGLLGLAVLLSFFALPRSTPVVGGIVLALRTLPVIIVSCRSALRAVPPSIRAGALAMGASETQAVFHHVLPLAMPGTLTGTIIGLAQALGETAPLLMIGMVAFIVDVPTTPLDPATVLPVQIYLWAESAERGFLEKTSAAIMIILSFLILMNITAIMLRQRFERRW